MIGPAELLAALERDAIDPDTFHHREHVALAWALLQAEESTRAIARYVDGLKRLAASVGRPERYHDTITWAFMLLIRERMSTAPTDTWAEFCARNVDVLTWQPSILERYYQDDTLQSALARQVFVMPDRLSS